MQLTNRSDSFVGASVSLSEQSPHFEIVGDGEPSGELLEVLADLLLELVERAQRTDQGESGSSQMTEPQ